MGQIISKVTGTVTDLTIQDMTPKRSYPEMAKITKQEALVPEGNDYCIKQNRKEKSSNINME